MHINSIQPSDTAFGARLKVINSVFDIEFQNKLCEKANKIGTPFDIIEIKYTNFQDMKENKVFGVKNIVENGMRRITDVFNGRFIPVGDEYGTDHSKIRLTTDKYTDLWKLEENAAKKYLHILSKKYTPKLRNKHEKLFN